MATRKILAVLVDAEPQDDQRNDGQMRHVAQHLQRGVEQRFGRPRDAVEHAEHEADAAADQQALQGARRR